MEHNKLKHFEFLKIGIWTTGDIDMVIYSCFSLFLEVKGLIIWYKKNRAEIEIVSHIKDGKVE